MTASTPSHPPIDPEVARALAGRDDVVTSLLPEQIPALRASGERPSEHQMTLGGAFRLTRVAAPGVGGHRVGLVLLTPHTGSAPVLYHVHGGGLVVGTAVDDLPALAALAAATGCAVASVDYRLAPEHPYPAAIDDVYSGLEWLAAHGADHGLESDRIVIHGISAGGGLAAAATLRARDRGAPRLLGSMLICPMLDDRSDSGSAVQMAGAGAWDRTANETGWSAYLGAERRSVPADAAPARAVDLSGLPPTFIDVGSAETFRDEDVDYAARIWAAGGDAELHVWPGGVHGFDALAPDSAIGRQAKAARIAWLSRVLVRSQHAAENPQAVSQT